MNELEKLAQYEKMHHEIQEEYLTACAKLDELRGQGQTKTATYKTYFARKLSLREWLDMYVRYGLDPEA